MIFAFLEKTIKIKDKSFSYILKKKRLKFLNGNSYHKLCNQVNIVGFIKNDESKSCLKYVTHFVSNLEN